MMHFNFHLTGDESPEQTRRVANAVLALGGLPHDSTGALLHGFDLASGPDVTTVSTVENGQVTSTVVVDGVMTASEIQALVDRTPPVPPVPATSGEWVGGQTPDPAKTIELPTDRATLDKNGLPWDERIHSSSRAINADGTWRYRKNVPDQTKQAVEAELRGLVGTVRVNMNAPPEGVPGLDGNMIDTVNIGAPPVVPLPPIPTAAPPVPVSTVQRNYSDVVNLIMANQATLNKPELYVSVLGMSLPEFAAACIAKPELATVAFNALDEIRRG